MCDQRRIGQQQSSVHPFFFLLKRRDTTVTTVTAPDSVALASPYAVTVCPGPPSRTVTAEPPAIRKPRVERAEANSHARPCRRRPAHSEASCPARPPPRRAFRSPGSGGGSARLAYCAAGPPASVVGLSFLSLALADSARGQRSRLASLFRPKSYRGIGCRSRSHGGPGQAAEARGPERSAPEGTLALHEVGVL